MINFFERLVSILSPEELEQLKTNLAKSLLSEESVDAKPLPKPKPTFNLMKIYEMYPRKLGRATGLKKLAVKIRSQEAYDLCFAAVIAYANHCKRENLDPKFIMHFSTWVVRYEDWIPQASEKAKELTPDFGNFFQKL